MDEQQTQKPIEEMFPQLTDGLPPSMKWADLFPGGKVLMLDGVMKRQLGLQLHYGRRGQQFTDKQEAWMLEWSLRHGKPHPALPVRPWSPDSTGDVTVD